MAEPSGDTGAPIPPPPAPAAGTSAVVNVSVGTFEVFSLWLVPWTVAHYFAPALVVSPFLSNVTATAFSSLYHPFVLRDGAVATLASVAWHLLLMVLSTPDLSVAGVGANLMVMLLYSLVVGDVYSVYFVKLPAVARRTTFLERWSEGWMKTRSVLRP